MNFVSAYRPPLHHGGPANDVMAGRIGVSESQQRKHITLLEVLPRYTVTPLLRYTVTPLLRYSLLLLLAAPAAQAATYYVRTDGNNTNTGLTNTSGGAWRTIDWAADHVSAGDVVRVQPGTYEERVTPAVNGTSVANTVTFMADGAVTVCGFDFTGNSFIRVIGFVMDSDQGSCNMQSGVVLICGTVSYLEFWNNTIRNGIGNGIRCGYGCTGVINNSLIIGNTLANFGIGNGSGMAVGTVGDNSLIAYNEVYNSHPDGFLIMGSHNRWIGNYTHDFSEASGGHSDVFQTGSNNRGWSNSLIESHFQVGVGNAGDEHTAQISHGQPGNCTGACGPMTENIFRRNVWHNVSSGGVGINQVTVGPITHIRYYNNTAADLQEYNPTVRYGLAWYGTLVNHAYILNNLEYESWGNSAASNLEVYCLSLDNSCNRAGMTYQIDYNLGYDPQGAVTFAPPFSTQLHGQWNANPQFVDYANDDFHLQSHSGARGRGGPLTATSGGGTGTTFNVLANGGGFFRADNLNLTQYGGNLVVGDVITVGDDTVRISAISGDAITVMAPFTWANGEPVYYGSNAAPDIGAYSYRPGGYDLSATYSQSGGVVTVTPSDAELVRFVVCYEDRIPTTVDNASPYTCSVGGGSLDVRVYPLYASKTLYVAATSGAPPPPDTTPPSVPTGLAAVAVSSTAINLSWTASTDAVGVAGYGIYRNGVWISSVTSGTSYISTGLVSSTSYSYRVTAYDAAGNVSALSAAASATTQAPTSPPGIPWSGILDPARAIDWSQAGVVGGIPNRTTICATLPPFASAAEINSAIQACPSGQVVYIPAGTYTLSEGIDFNGKNNVTLRGAGADKTYLNFLSGSRCRGMGANICVAASDNSYYVESPRYTANWTAGYAKGTTQITLSHTTGLSVGMVIVLDQLNDPADTGAVFACDTGGVCADQGPAGGAQPNRAQQQFTKVSAIAGNLVTISPGLYMPNWRASQSPHAWWGNSSGFSSGNGVEDLSVDNTFNTSGNRSDIYLIWCYDCWVKNVRDLNSDRNHVWLYESAHCTVRDSYFYGTRHAASQSYGVESYMGSDNLVENNIFHHIAGPLMVGGSASGLVEAYNYAFDDYYAASANWMQGSNYAHAAGTEYILHEGNEGPGFTADVIHGTHHFITAFRNYFIGWETGKTAQTVPVNLYSFTRFFNIIGNVLGRSGYHTNYESVTPSFTSPETSIFRLGDSGNLPASFEDPLVKSTLLRWGNYDTVNGTSRFLASEVPSGLSQFSNPVPSTNDLPASLYLSAKPSWWPTAIPWPSIGPDVTGGNVSGVGGHVYKIPARVCFETTSRTNGVLNFNANNCYGPVLPPPPPPPPPPPGGLATPTLDLPAYLPVNAQVSAGYTGSTPAAYFGWTFNPIDRIGAPANRGIGETSQTPARPVAGSPVHAPSAARSASFTTQTPQANLATAGLDLGPYVVTVTAYDAAGTASAPASAQVTLVSANLDQVRVYPNPWRSDRHAARSVTFDSLTIDTEIKIFTVSGHHVKTLPTSSSSITWDLTNESGDRVASGIYVYVLKADGGAKKTGQVVVIK